MMRVVLDVNVIVSGFTSEGGVPSLLLSAWSDLAFKLVTSEHILDKAANTWRKPFFQARYGEEQAWQTVNLLRSAATLVVPDPSVRGVAPNAEDDLVLATAVAGRADYLVTGDIRFREKVGRHQGVVLLSPREFLDLLESSRPDDSP